MPEAVSLFFSEYSVRFVLLGQTAKHQGVFRHQKLHAVIEEGEEEKREFSGRISAGAGQVTKDGREQRSNDGTTRSIRNHKSRRSKKASNVPTRQDSELIHTPQQLPQDQPLKISPGPNYFVSAFATTIEDATAIRSVAANLSPPNTRAYIQAGYCVYSGGQHWQLFTATSANTQLVPSQDIAKTASDFNIFSIDTRTSTTLQSTQILVSMALSQQKPHRKMILVSTPQKPNDSFSTSRMSNMWRCSTFSNRLRPTTPMRALFTFFCNVKAAFPNILISQLSRWVGDGGTYQVEASNATKLYRIHFAKREYIKTAHRRQAKCSHSTPTHSFQTSHRDFLVSPSPFAVQPGSFAICEMNPRDRGDIENAWPPPEAIPSGRCSKAAWRWDRQTLSALLRGRSGRKYFSTVRSARLGRGARARGARSPSEGRWNLGSSERCRFRVHREGLSPEDAGINDGKEADLFEKFEGGLGSFAMTVSYSA
ncbi:hypothetical protein BKA62DRAFT_673975 [Auriculariales sp. MPI-PUGE-AT-0066]|nr:hypothetical protein BKA62DRAFT_673975 [Auriculariales sp. MPI-PUGE-AT-0066]